MRRSDNGAAGRRGGSPAPQIVLTAILAALALGCGSSGGSGGEARAPILVVGKKGQGPGRFVRPRAVALDPDTGAFYVVDRTGRIQHFDSDGTPLRQWRLPESERGQPVGLAVDPQGCLLVNDSHYQRILRFAGDGTRLLSRWGERGTGPGEFICGRDIVVDSAGFIYAGDYNGEKDRIQKFTPSGEFVLEWGGCGEEPGMFRRPQGMAVEPGDGDEWILVADAVNHRVQRFTRDGEFVASIGTHGAGPGELKYPYAVAVGPDGSLFVCEWGNHRIQRFAPDGRPLGVWGRAGRAEGELWHPWDVEVGRDGRLHVADSENHRVQIFLWPEAGSRAGAPPAPGETGLAGRGSGSRAGRVSGPRLSGSKGLER